MEIFAYDYACVYIHVWLCVWILPSCVCVSVCRCVCVCVCAFLPFPNDVVDPVSRCCMLIIHRVCSDVSWVVLWSSSVLWNAYADWKACWNNEAWSRAFTEALDVLIWMTSWGRVPFCYSLEIERVQVAVRRWCSSFTVNSDLYRNVEFTC